MLLELKKGQDAIEKLSISRQKEKILEKTLGEYSSLIDIENKEVSIKEVIEKVREFEKIQKLLHNRNSKNDNTYELVKDLQSNASDISGQNLNLRNKLKALGNGLDHPPCWANPITGKIEYVFDIIINESSLDIKAGWPASRHNQVIESPNILKVIGNYKNNYQFWSASKALFDESKSNDCRHFVRVYDNSTSKSSFKSYLLGIENHFYKFLSNDMYEQQ